MILAKTHATSSSNSSHKTNKLNVEAEEIIEKIAELILDRASILFTSGAGMGVSSGLGTFRGVAVNV